MEKCCEIPIINECSRTGDMVDALLYVFDTDITGWDFYYESTYLNGSQVIKKSWINGVGNGLTVQEQTVNVDGEDVEMLVLIFDQVDNDLRKSGNHEGFLKVVIDSDEPSTILQYSIEVKPKVVS